MAAPKGHKRYGGRAKGQPNKKTETLMEKCERRGVDLFEALIDTIVDKDLEPNIRFGALKEACQYLYPKRKAIEHSGEISNPYAGKTYNELKELVATALKEDE